MKLLLFMIAGVLFLHRFQTHAQEQPITFEQVKLPDGLGFEGGYCMLQDKKGYMWFGTTNGLHRYDGYTSKVYKYDPQDTTSLANNFIIVLFEDRQGTLWIGTNGGGLCRFDPHTETFVRYYEQARLSGMKYQGITTINQDEEGMLWLGTFEGVFLFNPKTGNFTPVVHDPTDEASISNHQLVTKIYKDRQGTLWIGSNQHGLDRVNRIKSKVKPSDTITFTHYRHDPANPNSLSSNSIWAIVEDHAGVLWVGTGGGGLNQLDIHTNTFARYQHDPADPNSMSSNNFLHNGLIEDQQGNLWIGTDNGLTRFNRERTRFTTYYRTTADGKRSYNNSFISLFIDKAGTLWTATEGFQKVDPNQRQITLLQHQPGNENSLLHNDVWAVLENRKGYVWIGTDGGLSRLDPTTGTFVHYRPDPASRDGLRSGFINALLEDRDGNIWIGGGSERATSGSPGFCKLDPTSGKFTYFLEDLPPGVSTIFEDRQGIIWFGTAGNGLRSYDPKRKQWQHYAPDANNSNGWVHAICEDEQGNLWIGLQNGLTKLNAERSKFTTYQYNSKDNRSLSYNRVLSLCTDRRGHVWIGTDGGGLCRYNTATDDFERYTQKEGLLDNSVGSIVEDEEGNLWLATNKGLCRFTPDKNTFTYVDIGDGFPENQAIEIQVNKRASFKGKDGTLYFGGSNGLKLFHPREIRLNSLVPPVVITQFKLFDQPLPGKQEATEIELEHDQNFFSFEFAALNYTNPEKNQYAYKLEGVDQDWVQSGTRRFASYTDVAPGEYTFHVKGSNNDGAWNEQGASLQVTILPPFWRTWWAYGFYGLCFLAGVIAVDRFQRKRLIHREREKAREKELAQAHEIEKAYHALGRKSTELEHQKEELQSTLEHLQATQAQLIQKEKMASLGELTAGIAHEIQNPLNFVNNFSEVSSELVEELQEELDAGNTAEGKTISENIKQNLEKIHHHGKRADSIVKNMLQHSRASSGEKLPTDLNKLADEYLRLSYHGMRAKDKDFNAGLVTDFDPQLGKVEVVPQELGRVLLNLYNNAFYATEQKRRIAQDGYLPEVKVSTKKLENWVEIRVKDNGMGIPEAVKQKIFQPFFTTKPTGQGTGLGLSLSYDIITKGHGGELKVETKEAKFTEFIILLPD